MLFDGLTPNSKRDFKVKYNLDNSFLSKIQLDFKIKFKDLTWIKEKKNYIFNEKADH